MRFYEGADGLKTGFTDNAGYCLAATAKRDDLRLIAVVLGEANGKTRNNETMELLNYGFNTVKFKILKNKGEIIKKIKLDKANINIVDIVLRENLGVISDVGKKNKYTYDIKVSNLNLPISVGDDVGDICVFENNKKLNCVNLTVKNNINKLSFYDLFIKCFSDIIVGEY